MHRRGAHCPPARAGLTFDPALTYELDAFPVGDSRLSRAWETDTFYRLCFRASGAAGDFTFRIE